LHLALGGRNGITNVEFIAADAAKEMPQLVKRGVKADVVVFDPIRAGCKEEVLKVGDIFCYLNKILLRNTGLLNTGMKGRVLKNILECRCCQYPCVIKDNFKLI